MKMDKENRVVVTGLGTINPLGNDVATTWDKVVKGISGIDGIKSFDPASYNLNSHVGGEIKDFDPISHYPDNFKSKAKRMDPFVHYAQVAFKEAINHSGIDLKKEPERIGISLGTGIGGMHINRNQSQIFFEKGAKRISPFYIPAFIGNMAAGFLSIVYGIKGPNLSLQTACASGNHAIITAKMIIENKMADVMITGATEGILEPLSMSGFDAMRALSTKYNGQPATSSRPYDKGRDGFVLGEGSAVLVLESYEHAKNRGANIICELASVGMSGDAYDIVIPCADGEGAFCSMNTALRYGGINPDEIGYINAHGTSTPLGDIAETKAIKRLMGGRNSGYHVGSSKSLTGHLIGAASAIEAIISILSLTNNVVPGNINIFDFDEETELNLDIINTQTIETDLRYTMSNSFGFGGHNSTVIFKKFS